MKKTNVIQFPKTFTTNEAFVERIREEIFESRKTYNQLAADTGVGRTTIAKIANGTTRWPKHTTLFPLLAALNLHLELRSGKRNK